jgi:hypothetical protein
MPPDPSVAVATTVLELPASDQARSIVALGPRASNPDDAHQFEALACGGSDCAFYVSSGDALARDPELPTIPNDDYRHIECRRPGDSCDLCIASPRARLCLAGNTFKPEGVAVPDVGICCPIAANETRWAVDADFRGLSRLALTQSGDLLNDFAATTTGGACCIQETGFTDAVGFDVIACGQASNPMILTGSTLFGTTSCAMSH